MVKKDKVCILFAGDSGDGIQLTGTEFSNTVALAGNDLSTFPDFPAEIRAPQGTVSGVSGFKVNFGSTEIFTPGGLADVMVVMNVAALRKNISQLRPGGLIIANTSGFDPRNLKLAGYDSDAKPLEDKNYDGFKKLEIDVTKLTREALKESELSMKEKDRSKNMFVLGLILWLHHKPLDHTQKFIEQKFKNKPHIMEANLSVLKAGFHFGETIEASFERVEVAPAKLPPGEYRNAIGNQVTAIALVAAAEKSGLDLFYAGYPITPASDILHELSKHKNFGVKTFQAEDEIAAVTAAIGASFGGKLGVTASSGPGIALKAEGLGLAVMLELPLVVINVQRGGPSTGLPTKTEQADLLQALYGRNGEAPIPVLAAHSPSDCFWTTYEAAKIAIEHMTPVFVLSDGYIANGAGPWRFPNANDLAEIIPPFADSEDENYQPYLRDDKGVRRWAIPGTKGLEHRVGGLEKQDITGDVSYEPDNHEIMVKNRKEKIDAIAKSIPLAEVEDQVTHGDVLVLGWGSTYGAIKTAVHNLRAEGKSVGHLHLRHIQPMPSNTGDILKNFKEVLIPELNNGQLIKVIRDVFLIDAKPLNKIKGLPFLASEIEAKCLELL